MEKEKAPNSGNKPRKPLETSPLFARLGKRGRPFENDDDLRLDKLFNQKRFLSEVMASSLSSLKVNDSSRIDQSPSTSSKFQLQFAHSPSRTEGACGSTRSVSSLHGDEILSTMDSSMSEDSDDSCGWQVNIPTQSPNAKLPCVSKPRCINETFTNDEVSAGFCGKFKVPADRPPSNQNFGNSIAISRPFAASHLSGARGGNFPSSPSDSLNVNNLRRMALLRSLQLGNATTEGTSSPLRTVIRTESVCSREETSLQLGFDLKSYVPPTHKERAIGHECIDDGQKKDSLKEKTSPESKIEDQTHRQDSTPDMVTDGETMSGMDVDFPTQVDMESVDKKEPL